MIVARRWTFEEAWTLVEEVGTVFRKGSIPSKSALTFFKYRDTFPEGTFHHGFNAVSEMILLLWR